MRLAKNILRYIFIGILLLFLLHFETLSIGRFKISLLWKGILLVYLFIIVLKNRQINYFIYKPLILLSILQLFNSDIVQDPVTAIVNFLTVLIIPLIGIYILNYDSGKLKKSIIFFSSFIILSFLPYQLGILTSIESGYDLEIFGGGTGLIGPYQNPHGASISLACSLVVVLYFLIEGFFPRIYLSLIFILGSYFLLVTYVRTGLVMFAVGVIPILFYFGKKNAKTLLKILIVGFFLAVLASKYISSNEVLLNRIMGRNEYNAEDSFENIGSGRISFWEASISIFKEADIIEKIFGMGQTEKFDRMYQKIGMEIGSHNAFFDLLLSNGILGLFLFIFYLFKIFKFSLAYNSDFYILILALLSSYIAMCFFQGFTWLNANLIIMFAIGIKFNSDVCSQTNN
jgi:O-antigen ligase